MADSVTDRDGDEEAADEASLLACLDEFAGEMPPVADCPTLPGSSLVGPLDLYGLAEQVLSAEHHLANAQDPVQRLLLLTTLAWYNRQRDTRLALEMMGEAMDLLPYATFANERELRRLTARLLLIKAEAKALFAELDQAEALLESARATFRQIGDLLGEGDAAMTEALLALDRGQTRRRILAHRNANSLYQRAGDMMRQQIAQAWMARDALFGDAAAAAAQWAPILPEGPLLEHPGLDAVAAYFHGGLCFSRGDFMKALRHYQRGCDQAMLAGQMRLAVLLAGNVGAAHANLNDYVSEFLWRERAHGLARATGWPAAVGQCLRGMGDTLRRLQQTGRARHLLLESLEWLAPFGRSRNHAIACQYLGDLELDVGDPAAGLRWFDDLLDIARDLEQGDLQVEAQCGRARALTLLGHCDPALAAADQALALVHQRCDRWREIDVLRARAGIHQRFPDLAPPPGLADGETAPIHYLRQALDLAGSIQGYTVSADLLSALANAYEAAGDMGAALHWERKAGQARGIIHSREVSDRLLAMQAGFETERLKAEGDYHRQLAAAEAARAAALHEATQTLEQLGRIGQQITATLDAEAVFHALHRHAGTMMEMDAFSIYVVDETGENLDLRYGLEFGRPLPAIRRALSDSVSLVARCARERHELLVLRGPHEQSSPSHIPGTRFMRTLLLAPLVVGARLWGVMTVQSAAENAYGEREKLVFRTLCAYGAIALSNAAAYAKVDSTLSELRATQGRLVQQEKHASLGQLVAGVAHEINTPLGVAFTLATHLQSERDDIARAFGVNQLKRGALEQFLEKLDEGLRILTGNLERAADLIRSFKQVSADRSSEALRTVDLVAYVGDVLKSLEPIIRQRRVNVAVDGMPGLTVTTLPGLLAQVVANLVQNAIVHGFAGVERPEILIAVGRASPDRVSIAITDNGVGMPPEVLSKAFDPFFTTKRDSGGTGLGLHIVHNLVTGPLQGAIDLASVPGHGTRFLITLPLALRAG
ncbi:GAF domain-containing sensor histidine kinase [Niveispirillum sp.]|uniref:sensor histidine kinase n=1 Tax=Niveispirillum sp. TaxID=1917217 RepID=UPI001B492DBC|nr:GAF domain-containing sensor histidine kinase [Niveispirillum sp.]MBP7334682.1 GAF domain-containing sensor histidine kinase [Niveispirillum sp.]